MPLNHDLSESTLQNVDVIDAEEYYIGKIFATGGAGFSITTIKDALSKYVEPAILDLRNFTDSQLKMKVIDAVNLKVRTLFWQY